MPALDDVIRDERKVVADEDARAKSDADGERLVVAIAESYRVLVVCCEETVGRNTAHHPQ